MTSTIKVILFAEIFEYILITQISILAGFSERSKQILHLALFAIEQFSLPTMIYCVGELDIYCRFQLMFDQVDQSYTVDKIYRTLIPLKSNVPSTTTTTTTTTTSTEPTTQFYDENYIEDDELDELDSLGYSDYIFENANLIKFNETNEEEFDESTDLSSMQQSYFEHVLENAGLVNTDYLNKDPANYEDMDLEITEELDEDIFEESGSGNENLEGEISILDNFDYSGDGIDEENVILTDYEVIDSPENR